MALTEEFDDIKKSSADPVNSGGEPGVLICHGEAQSRPDTPQTICIPGHRCKAHTRGGFKLQQHQHGTYPERRHVSCVCKRQHN